MGLLLWAEREGTEPYPETRSNQYFRVADKVG